MKQNTTGSRSG